jgi:hypothetical protein
MIGYHHVLMIIIAVAIILLCKFRVPPEEFLICLWNVSNNAQLSCWPDALHHLHRSPISF